MKRRSLLTVIASICLIFIFLVSMALVPSCAKEAAPPGQAPTYDWKTSTNVGPEWPSSIYVLEWIDLIKNKSDGRINITPYWADALGDWVWVMEQVMRGEIESASNPLPTDVDPKLNASHMVYLFIGYDGAKKLLGPGGKLFGVYKDLLAADNMYLLGSFPTGAYGITSKEKVVRNPDQAKGVKCRTMPVKACELGVGAMGFSAVPIPFSELYTALQTGIVDARAEATPIEPMMFKDVTSVHIMTYDNFELHWTVWNLDLWNSLSKQAPQAGPSQRMVLAQR